MRCRPRANEGGTQHVSACAPRAGRALHRVRRRGFCDEPRGEAAERRAREVHSCIEMTTSSRALGPVLSSDMANPRSGAVGDRPKNRRATDPRTGGRPTQRPASDRPKDRQRYTHCA